VAFGAIPRHHDEVRTRNRNLVTTIGRTFASGWAVSLTLPVVDRDHLHIHNHHGAQLTEQWNFREVGDASVIGRYQWRLGGDESTSSAGLLAGLKLPTGRRTVSNDEGEVAERSLQPGTGTTDLIVGGFWRRHTEAGTWHAQAQYAAPLKEKAGFRPGAQLTADLGFTRSITDRLSAAVQLNLVAKRKDAGAEAEPADSGSRSLYLSPGLAYAVSDALRVYAFYQQPLHQHVNGVQLTANRAFVAGVSMRF
jgi:hypothetical protein